MSRVLRLKLSDLLKQKQEQDHLSRRALAKEIGISSGKLEKMLNDDWTYITRDSIERVADRYGLEVQDIFEFAQVDFWRQIKNQSACIFLRGACSTDGAGHRRVPTHDNRATSEVQTFLSSAFENNISADRHDFLGIDTDIIQRAKDHNCIAIGSPKSNLATEILLARLWRAAPSDSSPKNCELLPVGFCWPKLSATPGASCLAHESQFRADKEWESGIAIRGKYPKRGGRQKYNYVVADYQPARSFFKSSLRAGKDCALIVVKNRPFDTDKDVKLIVLAGFSGMGTIGAAKALVKDYRDLEPLPSDPDHLVYGVISVAYTKKSDRADGREFSGYSWRFRRGGREPIDFQSEFAE